MTWFQYTNGSTGTSSTAGGRVFISSTSTSDFWAEDSLIKIENLQTKISASKPKGMPAKLFFKLMKKKMSFLQDIKYKNRIKKIEVMAQKALDDGQEALGEEFLRRLLKLDKEAQLFSVGIKMYLSEVTLKKFFDKTERKKVQLTHIKKYARVIPQEVLDKKEKVKSLFDDFLILHADAPGAVMETEKERMEREKDPILFGICKDIPDKMFFIADWEDEFCDLTFDEIIDLINPEDAEMVLPSTNKIKL